MTIPYYGKREPGLLTAASPGDTLYFAFAAYNDSGDSEALSGFAVTDIEVIKNGAATVRATDSGYSLVSDTGMVGDRAGLYRCSVQLFNTADDASFYATGSWYQAFVDSVTIDGMAVRLWLGSWEIGRQKVNAVEIDSDTGAADVLQKFADGAGTLNPAGELDTGSVANGSAIAADTKRIDGDTGAGDQLQKAFASGFSDTGVQNRLDKIASDTDTGIKDGVWDSAARTLTANTNLSGLQVDVTQIDSDTGAADQLAKAFATTPTYFQQVDVQQLDGDTGAANQLEVAFAGGFNDTGINDRLGRIGFDVDTGLRAQLSDVDTGLHDHLNDIDTGLRDYIDNTDTGLRARINTLAEDTGGVNINAIAGDTGAAAWLRQTFLNGFADTGLYSRLNKLPEDTGGVNINSIQGDTGAAAWLRATFASGFTDTGLNQRLGQIQSDVDTGLRDVVADLDTGLRDHIDNTDTGLRARLNTLAEDTGGVNVNAIAGDTGAASWMKAVFATGFTDTGLYARLNALAEDTGGVNVSSFSDTGINDRLARILADTDTGIQSGVTVSSLNDTGLNAQITAVKAKTDKLTFDTGNELQADIRKVNGVTVGGAGSSGNPWGPAS